jgi:hypothetical protein
VASASPAASASSRATISVRSRAAPSAYRSRGSR